MSLKKFVFFYIFHSVLFAIGLLSVFSVRENSDMSVAILATFIYSPFVLILALLNLASVSIGLFFLKIRPYYYLTTIITCFVITTWYIANGRQIQIHYWTLSALEFLTWNIIIFAVNLSTVYLIKSRQTSTSEQRQQTKHSW